MPCRLWKSVVCGERSTDRGPCAEEQHGLGTTGATITMKVRVCFPCETCRSIAWRISVEFRNLWTFLGIGWRMGPGKRPEIRRRMTSTLVFAGVESPGGELGRSEGRLELKLRSHDGVNSGRLSPISGPQTGQKAQEAAR